MMIKTRMILSTIIRTSFATENVNTRFDILQLFETVAQKQTRPQHANGVQKSRKSLKLLTFGHGTGVPRSAGAGHFRAAWPDR